MMPTALPRYRAILIWALVAFGFVAAIYDYAAGLNAGFSFDLRCNLRDFPNYYWAVHARDAGLNPFDIPQLYQHFNSFILWVYPSPLIDVFAPLARLDLEMAGAIFTMIKVVALGLAVTGWVRCFEQLRNDLLFAAFICIGLNLTLFHDVCGGNVAVFEAAAMAWAISFLLLGRLGWFFTLMALAGMWKLIPLGLVVLAIVLYPHRRAAWIGVALMGIMTAALIGLWWLTKPEEVEKWVHTVRFTFSIRINYFEGFKRLFWANIRDVDSVAIHRRPEIYAYVLVFLTIVSASVIAWWRSLKVTTPQAQVWRLLLGFTAFVALMPGNFIYSFVLALPFVYLPLRQALSEPNWLWVPALLGYAIALTPTVPWNMVAGEALNIYQPLLATTIAWVLLLAMRPKAALAH